MQSIFSILLLLILSSSNAFALQASDVDMSPAIADMSTVVASVLSFLVLLMGYKKTLSLLGR